VTDPTAPSTSAADLLAGLDAGTRARLRSAQIAHVKARLRGDAGLAELAKNLEAGWERVLASKVSDVIDPAAVARAVEAVLSQPALDHGIRPVARASALIELARLREDTEPLGTYVPEEARELLGRVFETKGLLPERFVREALTHRAFEEVMRDVLDGALKEFQEKANPLTAEWGVPSILKKAGPFSLGLGALSASISAVQSQIQDKLEPQRKIFLQSFARKALSTMADFVIKRHDEPGFVELRKELLAWLCERPAGELVATLDQKAGELLEEAASVTLAHVVTLDVVKRQRRAAIEMTLAAHGRQTVRQALLAYGVDPAAMGTHEMCVAAATAVWPAVKLALEAPAIDAWIEDVVGSFWDDDDPRGA
jgi:hypothetical protein